MCWHLDVWAPDYCADRCHATPAAWGGKTYWQFKSEKFMDRVSRWLWHFLARNWRPAQLSFCLNMEEFEQNEDKIVLGNIYISGPGILIFPPKCYPPPPNIKALLREGLESQNLEEFGFAINGKVGLGGACCCCVFDEISFSHFLSPGCFKAHFSGRKRVFTYWLKHFFCRTKYFSWRIFFGRIVFYVR